jgi:hypothetical protein
MGNLSVKEKENTEKKLYGYDDDDKDTKDASRRIVGTDATYHAGDLLRFTDKSVIYSENPPQITKEELPVPGAFLLHNVLTADECRQYIEISESMG